MTRSVTESVVEEVALVWLESGGWVVVYRPDIWFGGPFVEGQFR